MTTHITNKLASLRIDGFEKRTHFGKLGKKLKIHTNFFEITKLPQICIYQFDVNITPDVPPILNRRIWAQLEANHFRGFTVVFDGRRLAFSLKDVGLDNTFTIQLPEDDGNVAVAKRPPREFRIRIRKAGQLQTREIINFLNDRPHDESAPIQALDILCRHKSAMEFFNHKNSFFTSNLSQPVGNGAEVWKGFYQSIRPGIGKLYLNCDTSICPMYQRGNLVSLAAGILGKSRPEDLSTLNDAEKRMLSRNLKGLQITVVHRGESASKKRFKIVGLSTDPAAAIHFDEDPDETKGIEGKKKISLVDYFYFKYNRRLQQPGLPCITVRKNTFLPMEVCEVAPGQRFMRKLNERQTAALIKITCTPPSNRIGSIKEGMALNAYDKNKAPLCFNISDIQYLQNWGLEIKSEPAVINARVLPTPQVQYHQNSKSQGLLTPQNGVWNLLGQKVCAGAELGSWAIVCFAPQRNMTMPAIEAFVKELCNSAVDSGMTVRNRAPPIMYANSNTARVELSLREAFTKAGNAAKAQPQLIVCILPTTGTALYGEIKRITDTILGISSQCNQMKHVANPKRQYCANVILKVNAKLGGANVYLPPRHMPFVSERPTIIMGADVNHPAPGDSLRPSFCSVIASMDSRACRYSASLRAQGPRVEIISDLEAMTVELFKTFYQQSKAKPERVLFFRDGVSEGQFAHVVEAEIKAIRSACETLEKGYRPNITFIVVAKRHHARFFPVDRRDADRTGNCPAGTVVDTDIVHPQFYDYFLLSHPGLQGTSRPTHYSILVDENKLCVDDIQALCYNLCHVYARCTRVVSIVPPVYYAHLVGRRARFHTKVGASGEPTEDSASSIGNTGNTMGTDEANAADDAMVAAYAPVRPSLQKIMYYM